jgi:hypothetical protein
LACHLLLLLLLLAQAALQCLLGCLLLLLLKEVTRYTPNLRNQQHQQLGGLSG